MREFIQFDYIFTNEGNSSNSGESIVNIEAASKTEVMNACNMVSMEEELELLENAKRLGVVYLLGDSEVIANKDSSCSRDS